MSWAPHLSSPPTAPGADCLPWSHHGGWHQPQRQLLSGNPDGTLECLPHHCFHVKGCLGETQTFCVSKSWLSFVSLFYCKQSTHSSDAKCMCSNMLNWLPEWTWENRASVLWTIYNPPIPCHWVRPLWGGLGPWYIWDKKWVKDSQNLEGERGKINHLVSLPSL